MRIAVLLVFGSFFFLGLTQGATELFVAEGLAVEFAFLDFHLEADVAEIEHGAVYRCQEEQEEHAPVAKEVGGRSAQAFHIYTDIGHTRACGKANSAGNTPAALGQHMLHPGAASLRKIRMVNVLPTRALHRFRLTRCAACAFPSGRSGRSLLGAVRWTSRPEGRKLGEIDFHQHGHRLEHRSTRQDLRR